MSLINKMNVGNTDYDIQDRLMPDTIGQAGQVLKVKDDGSGLEFSTIESGGVQFVEVYGGRPITEEKLAALKANKANQIIYYGGAKYYFKLAYEKSSTEWVYATFVDSATTLTVNMTTGSAILDFVEEKQYKHDIKMNHNVYGFSEIIFNSTRSTPYTIAELSTYIKTFPLGAFTAKFKKEDNVNAYIFDTYIQGLSSSVICWYGTTYGENINQSKEANSITSDTVTEV